MAGPLDFFQPGEWQDPLADPKARAALLQTGIALAQPTWGGTPFSNLMAAIGQGAEAPQRATEQDRKDAAEQRAQQEADSRDTLRASQADAATSRSQTAASMADIAAQKLQLANEKEKLKISDRLKAARLYDQYVKETNAYNAKIDSDILATPAEKAQKKQRLMSREDWILSQPGLREIFYPNDNPLAPTPAIGPGGAPIGGGPTTGSTPAAPAGAPQQGAPQNVPVAVRGDTNRKPGNYQTPTGVKYWNGTGWDPAK